MADLETRILNVLRQSDDWLMDAALRATTQWLDIPGSALTVNREKMRRRLKRALQEAEKRAINGDGEGEAYEQFLLDTAPAREIDP